MKNVSFNVLEGKVLLNVVKLNESKGLPDIRQEQDSILFFTEDNTYVMTHYQGCCEIVYIKDICGDLQDLIGNPILKAEVSTNINEDYKYGHMTWTYYKLATINGYVDISWEGESNGYYSEDVDFLQLEEDDLESLRI